MSRRIDEATFASTNLRWALLLEDHPQAEEQFSVAKGTELGIPANYGGDKDHLVASIVYPDRAPHVGFKAIEDRGDDEGWSKLQSQALGRALKRAGYPDKLSDLKALLLWRQRLAEIAALANGQVVSEPAAVEEALDEAETETPDDETPEEPQPQVTGGPSPLDPVSEAGVEAVPPAASPRESSSGEEEQAPSTGEVAPPSAGEPLGPGGGGEALAGSEDLEVRRLVERFTALPAPIRSEALALKRKLGIRNWYEADADSLALIKAKVVELEAANA